ncbi:MAG: hypothetical protein ACK559_13340, partial [bacterium]
EVDHLVGLVVDLDLQAVAEVGGLVGLGHLGLLRASGGPRGGGAGGGTGGAGPPRAGGRGPGGGA